MLLDAYYAQWICNIIDRLFVLLRGEKCLKSGVLGYKNGFSRDEKLRFAAKIERLNGANCMVDSSW
jgi:hypothetical protein